jgi:hypothetical protein
MSAPVEPEVGDSGETATIPPPGRGLFRPLMIHSQWGHGE